MPLLPLRCLTIQYLRDLSDPESECWAVIPFKQDIDSATAEAREGYRRVSDYLGATGFRIVDGNGLVLAEEARA